MTKLYVKLTDEKGNVFSQELPLRTLRFKGDNVDKEATLLALKKRLESKDDVLDYGALQYEVVDEETHIGIVKANELKAEETEKVSKANAQKPEAVERRKRIERAAKRMKELDYETAAEGVVALDGRVNDLEGPNKELSNADKAFRAFIGSYSIKASYPAKQTAMDKAVEKLGEKASVEELFKTATSFL